MAKPNSKHKIVTKPIKLVRNTKYQTIAAVVVIVAAAILGYFLFIASHASTPYVSAEAESGQLDSGGIAQKISDTNASGGSAVQFGALPGSGGGGQGVLTQQGTQLLLNGQPYKYGSFDFYGLTNNCQGSDYTTAQMDAYFSGLPPHTLTRTWAFPTASDNLANALTEAAKYNQLLILSLSDGNSYCNDLDGAPGGQGSGKTAAWYSGGYQTNYIPWVQKTVAQYKNSPALGMWEIQNEENIRELASESEVEGFMTAAAAEIKSIDPNHLVESGANDIYSWGGSCAPEASPNINVLSMHEYDYDQNGQIVSNHLASNLACANQYNKPLIVGEVGISSVSGSTRASVFQNKFNQYLAYGPVAGVNIWDYSPQNGDQYQIKPGDPTITMVQNYVAP